MARIFVAHQQEGAQSPLAGLADAVKEQRMMQEEQRRYDQQVVQEQQKLAIADKQMRYQRQRDQIEDRFRSQEIQVRRAGVEASAEAARLRAGGSRLSAVLDTDKLDATKFGAAKQVEDHFNTWSAIPVDQRMPQADIGARQSEYDEVLSQLQAAPDPATAKIYADTLDAMMAEDDERWETYSGNRRVQTLTTQRDELQEELLDPETLRSYGLREETILNVIDGSVDEENLRSQIDRLQDLMRMGKEGERLDAQLEDIASGKDKSPYAVKMQEKYNSAVKVEVSDPNAVRPEEASNWISKYPGWSGESGNYAKMTSRNTPIGERNELKRQYLGMLRLESDPELSTVQRSVIRMGQERDAAQRQLAEASTFLGAVSQATLPDMDTVSNGLRMIEDSEGVSPEARELARELSYVMMADEEMAEGVVRPTSLLSALEQVKANTPVTPEAGREVFSLISRMVPNGDLSAPLQEYLKESERGVLGMQPQRDPLGGTAGAGAVDFSIED
jgi:hypothetical protein